MILFIVSSHLIDKVYITASGKILMNSKKNHADSQETERQTKPLRIKIYDQFGKEH